MAATPTAHRLTVTEYLRSVFRPDCDYIDGEIQERNLGEYDHAAVQAALISWFRGHRTEWGIRVVPEQRVQVSPTRFRVPDICVLSRELPIEQIITHPPIICIEILSPEDTLRRTLERVEDYRHFGVKNVWIIDPATQQGYDCQEQGILNAHEFSVEGTPIRLALAELFADLD
jgi:Uma2 family endonuclease